MYRDGKLKACKDIDERKNVPADRQLPRSSLITGIGLGEVTGDREIRRIHEENMERLTSIDEREILAEKEKLLNSLGRRHCFCSDWTLTCVLL